jgi:hypothetical protein
MGERRELSQTPEAIKRRRNRALEREGMKEFRLRLPEARIAAMLVKLGFLSRLVDDQHDKITEALTKMILTTKIVPRDNLPKDFP